eukprot:1408653-Rhodomonas_salina.7
MAARLERQKRGTGSVRNIIHRMARQRQRKSKRCNDHDHFGEAAVCIPRIDPVSAVCHVVEPEPLGEDLGVLLPEVPRIGRVAQHHSHKVLHIIRLAT